jgi:hypothetical protein
MLKALKVTMIVWGVLHILMGLAFIFIPQQLGQMFGYAAEGPEYILSFLASLGVGMLVPGIFVMVAARDPIKHIWWVKFAILTAVLTLVVELYSIIIGYVTFNQASQGIILPAVFIVAFLIFYPWRGPREA